MAMISSAVLAGMFVDVLPACDRLEKETSDLILSQLYKYQRDPNSVAPEWRRPLSELITRMNILHTIKPKEDEAFRLFSDEFYDAK